MGRGGVKGEVYHVLYMRNRCGNGSGHVAQTRLPLTPLYVTAIKGQGGRRQMISYVSRSELEGVSWDYSYSLL